MTLSGIAASDDTWAEIESTWMHILSHHSPPAPFMHMYPAATLREPFTVAKGWDDDKVAGLVNLLVDYISQIPKDRYCQFACTLDMNAYRKLQAETYQLEAPAEMLGNLCIDRIMYWYLLQYKGLEVEAHYYFDTGEPFEPIIKAKWERELESFRLTKIYNKWAHVKCISTAQMSSTPGIQVADMLAWAINRENNCFVSTYRHLSLALTRLAPSQWARMDEYWMRREYRPLIYKPYAKY